MGAKRAGFTRPTAPASPTPVTWRRPAPAERREWKGPLQEMRLDVDGAPGWIIVVQERRPRQDHVWNVQPVHTRHGWHGEDIPFMTSNPHLGFMPYIEARTPEERDAGIARWTRILSYNEAATYRDFTCPICRHTERDGNTGPNGAIKVCVYCRKESSMTRCPQNER